MADSAQGFGGAPETKNNDDQIRELLDQVQQLMIEDGRDPATAEALTNYARPASVTYAGNLADLNRMGKVAVQGRIETPPGEPDEETTNLMDAFKAPPPPPDPATGLQTPMGQIDAEGRALGGTEEGVASDDSAGAYEGMTKAQLQAELDSRGIDYSSNDTKADLIARLEEG